MAESDMFMPHRASISPYRLSALPSWSSGAKSGMMDWYVVIPSEDYWRKAQAGLSHHADRYDKKGDCHQ